MFLGTGLFLGTGKTDARDSSRCPNQLSEAATQGVAHNHNAAVSDGTHICNDWLVILAMSQRFWNAQELVSFGNTGKDSRENAIGP